MTFIPEGLLHDLPLALDDIEITHCNLSVLPDNLDSAWRHVGVVYLEHMELTEVPAVLARMEISDLSLAGNNINSVANLDPSSSTVNAEYFRLSLSGNPVARLPDRIGSLSNLQLVALENTQLLELPAWIYKVEMHAFKIYVHGTPFCTSKTPEERAARYGVAAVLTCADTNPLGQGRYPYELTRAFQVP